MFVGARLTWRLARLKLSLEAKVIVQCPSCSKRYRVEDKHFQGQARIQFKCPSCQSIITAEKAGVSPEPPPSTQKLQKMDATSSGHGVPDAHLLQMPDGKRISLAVLQGPDQGAIFQVTKPVIVIGRADADVELNDPEVSRRHAQIEVKGNAITLRDLKSTNGTYLNEQHVVASNIENNTEFRVGSTTLMLIVTENPG